MKKLILYISLLILSIFIGPKKGLSQKTDTIIHVNGNILTGDFKKMVYGVATWKMDGMGTISLEEVKINTMKSTKMYEIKMEDGFIYYGSIDSSHIDRKINIVYANGKDLVSIEDIVEIYPIRTNFWMRTSGKFNLGMNYSKGSDVATVSFSGNIDYRKRNRYFNLSWDDNNTIQGDSVSSSKSDITLAWQHSLKKNWSTEVTIGGSQNTELGTKLRIDIFGLGIKDILYNDWNRLYAGAGTGFSRETPYDDSGENNDFAGVVQLVWKVFKYTTPKIWVDANLSFLPYFTGDSRYRSAFNLNPQVSLFSDNFKVGFSFYYNYDSNPTSGASTNDYGINLELSYSFH